MCKRAGVVLLVTYLAACGSSPPENTYYSLVLDAAAGGVVQATGDAAINVNLTRIELPTFLESRALALQTGPNQVRSAHSHFWAEPLDEAIAKVLVRDITDAATGIDIDRDEQRKADCELKVEFDRFHATDDARVLASGRYWIASESGSQKQEFDVSQRLASGGYSSAVSTLRDSLRSLAGEISEEIENGGVCQIADPTA